MYTRLPRGICNSNFDNWVLNETISHYHFETSQHSGNNLEKEKESLTVEKIYTQKNFKIAAPI